MSAPQAGASEGRDQTNTPVPDATLLELITHADERRAAGYDISNAWNDDVAAMARDLLAARETIAAKPRSPEPHGSYFVDSPDGHGGMITVEYCKRTGKPANECPSSSAPADLDALERLAKDLIRHGGVSMSAPGELLIAWDDATSPQAVLDLIADLKIATMELIEAHTANAKLADRIRALESQPTQTAVKPDNYEPTTLCVCGHTRLEHAYFWGKHMPLAGLASSYDGECAVCEGTDAEDDDERQDPPCEMFAVGRASVPTQTSSYVCGYLACPNPCAPGQPCEGCGALLRAKETAALASAPVVSREQIADLSDVQLGKIAYAANHNSTTITPEVIDRLGLREPEGATWETLGKKLRAALFAPRTNEGGDGADEAALRSAGPSGQVRDDG